MADFENCLSTQDDQSVPTTQDGSRPSDKSILDAMGSGVQDSRIERKLALSSWANMAGCSSAAKWPPRSNSLK